jgi:hypothetical protein
MRRIIFIAAMALTSAAAQAGETRNLSTAAAPSDAPATIQIKQLQAQNDAPVATPAKPADTPRYTLPPSETQTPANPARNVSDAPRNTDRPASVDKAPPATASTVPSTVTPSPERRYDDRGYYDDAGYHPFPHRRTYADRDAERPNGYTDRPHHRARWSARRIIAELLRYGIYW